VTLRELAALLPGSEVRGDGDLSPAFVTYDSRRVGPGALFVAIRGASVDGNQFVEAARRKGAVAVASEAPPEPGVPWIRVGDAREALALFAAALLGNPAAHLELVGVTGTNGKTTTTYLVDAALRAQGASVGLVGTVEYRIGDRLKEAVRTTPESSDLQELLREMVDEGCRYAVLEVSSHALALKRVFGCPFTVAVFTNLTRDHLDFHGDMEAYFASKRVLFDTLLRVDGHAVINLEDPRAPALIAASRGKVWTYSSSGPADFEARAIKLSLSGTSFEVRTPSGTFRMETPLLGRFNVQNILAALGAASALGVAPEVAVGGIASVKGVPGRLEHVAAGQDFNVIVDYAHTDDALRKLLETIRDLCPRQITTVFGCGGDRDKTKRPLMGAVASRLSDRVILTSDNPRSEPPEAILEDIQSGIPKGRGAECLVIPDRRDAIARALELAQKGDAVVIAGKGHEQTQTLRDRAVPFDDRRVARELLGVLRSPTR
jgi:UDP-N-acetylmuramoyl-L-alanyl-D-glutamate--2,6-diaminopimelate ligase